jgi:hypothetical protein
MVNARHDETVEGIVSLDAKSDGHQARFEDTGQTLDVGQTELSVGVGEEHRVSTSAFEPGAQSAAIPLVPVVRHQPDLWMTLADLADDLRRCVRRPVVDHDDLEALRVSGQHLERLIEESSDVLGLVIGREEAGQKSDARRYDVLPSDGL